MKIYNMLQTIAAIAILLSTSLVVQGQAFGELHGKVSDENGLALPGATIILTAGEDVRNTATDIDGKFKIKPLVSGVYQVTVTFVSYHDKTITDIVIDPDRITYANKIEMIPNTVLIGGAVVEALYVELIDVDNTGMTTITAKELEHIPAVKNLGNFVAQMSSEISTNAEGTELYFRGSRAGTSQYIVDGVKIIGQAPRIPQSGLGSISVYTGGVPAKYGDVTGGVIVIETKNYFDEYNKKKYENK
jgi:hypothetical protein